VHQTVFGYFDRISVIHLPARVDRFRALRSELSRLDVDIGNPKIVFPVPPMPNEANGFRSRGVYGNFLSHLEIIESAYRDHLETVLVLESTCLSNRTRAFLGTIHLGSLLCCAPPGNAALNPLYAGYGSSTAAAS
jgi:hypothetical protein